MAVNAVLVVEDNPDDEALTLQWLRRSDATSVISVARDGAEALGFFFGPRGVAVDDGSRLPRLVLLDLHMNRMDGFEVLRRLRSELRTRMVPVVILNSSVEEELRQGYSPGVNSWVRKPVDFERFVEVVRQIGIYWLLLNERPAYSRSL